MIKHKMIKHRTKKSLIAQNDCLFFLPNALSHPKLKAKQNFPEKVSYIFQIKTFFLHFGINDDQV